KNAEAKLDFLNAEISRLGLELNFVDEQDSGKFQEIVDKVQEIQKLIEAKEDEVDIRKRLAAREPRTWRVILFLDGLDEVGDDKARRNVVRAVQTFAQDYPQCRIAVTCRVRSYEGAKNAKWQLTGWPVVTLANWTLEQMQHYIKAWYTAAAVVGNMAIETRDE